MVDDIQGRVTGVVQVRFTLTVSIIIKKICFYALYIQQRPQRHIGVPERELVVDLQGIKLVVIRIRISSRLEQLIAEGIGIHVGTGKRTLIPGAEEKRMMLEQPGEIKNAPNVPKIPAELPAVRRAVGIEIQKLTELRVEITGALLQVVAVGNIKII